jgi:hypothetical protein
MFLGDMCSLTYGKRFSRIAVSMFLADMCSFAYRKQVFMRGADTGRGPHHWLNLSQRFIKRTKLRNSGRFLVPQLRDMLRKIIPERVISDYRCYLRKHPELDKHVSSSPDELQEMLGELFEG